MGRWFLRVCRGVLFDPNDVEDAFQATFLVLVQKARSLWVCDSLGPWLHQVALRTASCARSTAARRRRHEQLAAERVHTSHTDSRDDLAHVLHEEINRLPDRFRMSVILCDLEGRTHEQAARHLGWPVGTVKSRLTRARERLRDRLTRRGLNPSAGVIALLRPALMEDLLPGALVHSTTSAAVRFGASGTLLGGTAAILAQGVITAMSMTRWWKVASVLVVAGATVSGAGLLSRSGGLQAVEPRPQATAKGDAGSGTAGADMPVASVNRGMFRIAASQRGVVEVSKSEDVYSPVEGNATVISIVPEGTKVKKGDLVCELDSAALRDQMTNQRIATQSAEAAFQNARLTREVAEIAVVEYKEGIYPSDVQMIQGEIKMAEAEFKNTEARLERSRRARQKLNDVLASKDRTTNSADIMAELDLDDRIDAVNQAMGRNRLALELAQSKLKRLNDYTMPKMTKELRTEVQKARSNELAKEPVYQLEKTKEAKLVKLLGNCKLFAPADGIVVYADYLNRHPGQVPPEIAGATVHDHYLVFRVQYPGPPMQVNAKVAELLIDRVQPGQKAQIVVDAFPGEEFSGTVTQIAPLPDPSSPGGGRKVYSTRVTLDKGQEFLRPGMTADVEILLAEHDNALTIPWEAVFHFDNKDHVAVKRPDGSFTWREVILGDGDWNRKLVQVKQGIEPGEQVALKPTELMSEYDKRQKGIGLPTRPAAKKSASAHRVSPAAKK